MKAVWENDYEKIAQAVYAEDASRVLQNGGTLWAGMETLLTALRTKVTPATKAYRVEDGRGVLVGFALIDHARQVVVERSLRPSQSAAQPAFDAVLNALRLRTNDVVLCDF